MPPSAWITSQSTSNVRSPSCLKSMTERRLRPMSRWISCVRPPCLPRAASRSLRVLVARGSMPYSAVNHPRSLALEKTGHLFVDRNGAQNPRLAELDQHRAFSVARVTARQADRAKLIRKTTRGTFDWHGSDGGDRLLLVVDEFGRALDRTLDLGDRLVDLVFGEFFVGAQVAMTGKLNGRSNRAIGHDQR